MSFESLKIGSTVEVGGIEWIVLDKNHDTALCLTRNFIDTCHFDAKTANFAKSELYKKLHGEFFEKVKYAVDDIYLDLTSDDGLDDYGEIHCKVGLLTCDMYRRYNRIIEKYPVNNWWWLSTAFSTPHRGYSSFVRVVSDGGTLNCISCISGNGVRPFCIFKSNIF